MARMAHTWNGTHMELEHAIPSFNTRGRGHYARAGGLVLNQTASPQRSLTPLPHLQMHVNYAPSGRNEFPPNWLILLHMDPV